MKTNHSLDAQENKQRKDSALLPDDRRTRIASAFKDCYFTVSLQTIKAALTSPVKSLKANNRNTSGYGIVG